MVRSVSSGYLDVVTTWLAGKPTAGMTLMGHSMLVWGRVGKLLQFVAGLSIVLDLIDPDKVRALGARALARHGRVAGRLRTRRAALKIVALRDAMLDAFMPPQLRAAERGHLIRYVSGEAPLDVPAGAPFDLAEYRALWARMRAELPGVHDCGHGESYACPAQERHA